MKTDKALAVELACSVFNAMATVKPVSGQDIHTILADCYSEVCALPESPEIEE